MAKLLSNYSGPVPNGDVELFTQVVVGDVQTDAPVLLLSEAEAPSSRWPLSLINALNDLGCPVIMFDTRDVGRSTWTVEPYGIDELVRDAEAVLTNFDVESAHVFGRSMGGIIAQGLALDVPQRVRSLTLVSTTPGSREDFGFPEQWLIDRMTERLYGDVPEGVVARVEWVIDQLEWFSGPLFEFDRVDAARAVYTEVTEMWRGQNNHGLAVVDAPDRFAELARVAVPTMVVHGTADPVYPVAHGQALAEQVPTAELHLIEGLGHDLPERFLPQLVDLFDRLRRSAG